MNPRLPLLAILLAMITPYAIAGRPLSTDDAGTVGHLKYQVEAWQEHADGNHGYTLAPAAGLGDFEFGVEFGRTHAAEGLRSRDSALAIKWAPEYLSLGPVRFGAKAWAGRSHESSEEETVSQREKGALAIASWSITETLSAHFNFGALRNQLDHRNERLANAAISWAPHERVLVFAEALHQQHQPTTQALGLRVWAIPEKLGVDFTASRQAGVSDSRTLGIGFGWYGDFGG